jgi:hypothetical protein
VVGKEGSAEIDDAENKREQDNRDQAKLKQRTSAFRVSD